jgi:inhibitor of KinA sporulation pathway (predicted exonuclease)
MRKRYRPASHLRKRSQVPKSAAMYQDIEHIIIVDVEATCDDGGLVPRREMEIIEIGAVVLDRRTLTVTDEFQAFVKPSRHPDLTPFCTQLTTIEQADVDAAEEYPDVATALRAWWFPLAPALWASWGAYDRTQFEQDSAYHDVPFPLPERHLNVKALFSERHGTRRRFGMAGALRKMGIPLTGTHHRGIDDARNIAQLAPFALGLER